MKSLKQKGKAAMGSSKREDDQPMVVPIKDIFFLSLQKFIYAKSAF
jgi:hypothetical protein